MSDWAHGVTAAMGVLVGILLLAASLLVGSPADGLLQLAAPLVMVIGFAIGMASDPPRTHGKPWLAMMLAIPVGGATAAAPWAFGAAFLVSRGMLPGASWDAWIGAAALGAMAAATVSSSALLAVTTGLVAVVDALVAWSRPRIAAV
jgi:hypothetical protein